MGCGIAFTFARAGIDCVVVDVSEQASREGHARVLADARAAAEAGLIAAEEANAIAAAVSWRWPLSEALDGCDLVVEAVTERLAAKHEVYARVEAAVGEDVVIATNTSAIPIADLAGCLAVPRRFLGIHWINPAPWVPGLEVVRGPDTDDAVVELVVDAHRRLGKRPVVVPDRAGFVANRLQVALLAEAARMVAEGEVASADIDEVVRNTFGFRLPLYGPFTIADLGGLDVFAAIFETLEREFGERFTVPDALADLVKAGKLGAKSGEGFLAWSDADLAAATGRRDAGLKAIGAAQNAP
jgi:3-hydroxybutyryl-CoA dehydrogenase